MAISPPKSSNSPPELVRLQKVLASAGLGSRRSCEELIVEGRVTVDGEVADQLGVRVDSAKSLIEVDGLPLKRQRPVYYAVNKPTGVVSTNDDPQRRMRVIDLVPNGETLFTIGRLDRSSEGLILVTNDGDLANRVAHPRYGVTKTYLVKVVGSPGHKDLAAVTEGVYFAEGFAKAESVKVKKRMGNTTELVIIMREGRNREIRRLLARIGFKVLNLKRTRVGCVTLAELPSGAHRELTRDEIKGLKSGGKTERPPRRNRQSRSGKKTVTPTKKKPAKKRLPKSDAESSFDSATKGTVLGYDKPTASSSDNKQGKKNAKKGRRPRKNRR